MPTASGLRADLDALDQMNSLVSRGVFDLDLALAMTRAIARSTDRLAVWQAQLVAETLQDQNGEAADIAASGPEAAAALLASFGELADELEESGYDRFLPAAAGA